jgi:putative DNA primase/helicase
MRWENDRWTWCEKEEQMHCAKKVAEKLMLDAQAVFKNEPERGKKHIQHAMNSHNLSRLEAAVKLAISEDGMTATSNELDLDPMILGVQNGVVDLKSGVLVANVPDMLITRFCHANYVLGAQCPRWLQFLYEVFDGDLETIETIQRALGYTLTGSITEEVLFICFGHGSNGKSVFNNVTSTIYGDYARMAPPSMLTIRSGSDTGPRNDLAALAGSRYVAINELQSGDRLDEQVVKMIAGREPISARFLHKEFFEFMPTFKPWLRTNHKPIIIGDDDGIWRRLVLIPFSRSFAAEEKDPHLESKLLAERDGILMWMIEGALNWLKDGLKLSPRIKCEINSYRSDSDLLGEFINEKCAKNPNAKIDQSTLFFRWQSWCTANGVKHGAKATFTRRLSERGYAESKSNGKRFYAGLDFL